MQIHEFQEMMHQLYFARDVKRGLEGTHSWLAEEVEELRQALKSDDRRAVENEFADVIAWLASLANIADVDLEKAALSKYEGKCPRCKSSPCICPF